MNANDSLLKENRSQVTGNAQSDTAVELPHSEEAFVEQQTPCDYASDDSDVEILEGNYGLVSARLNCYYEQYQ